MEEKHSQNHKENSNNNISDYSKYTVITNRGQENTVSIEHEPNTNKPTSEANNKPQSGIFNIIKKIMKREDASQWIMVGLTFAIVVFTAVTLYFGYKQINIYEETTQIENRAYVIIKHINAVGLINYTDTLFITLDIVNIGKTPAYNIRVFHGWKVGGTGVYESDFSNIQEIKTNWQVAIQPSDEPYIATIFIVNDTLRSVWPFIKSGEKKFFTYGKITYEDRFKNHHFVRYSFSVNPFVAGDLNMGWINDSD